MKSGIYEEIGGLEQPESTSQYIVRNIARGGARAAETFLGLPGDIVQGGLGLANLGIEKLTGQESPLPKTLPVSGSEEYRKYITKPLTGEYLEPKGKIEKGADEFVSDLTSLMVPVGPALGLKKAVAAAGLGNLASWVTEGIGGGEGAKTGAKIGGMLLATALNPGALRKEIKNLYTATDRSVPHNALTAAGNIERHAEQLEKKLKYGVSTPPKKELLNKITEIKAKINDKGLIPVKDVLSFKRDFNDLIRRKGGLPELEGIEKMLSPFLPVFDKTLEGYSKVNPKFNYKALKQADDMWRGSNVHSKVKKYLKDTVTIKNTVLGGLFGMAHPHALSKGVGAAWALRGAVQGLEPLLRSNNIKKYYLKTVNSALMKDKNATLRNIANLEKVIEKEHPESKSSGMYEEISL